MTYDLAPVRWGVLQRADNGADNLPTHLIQRDHMPVMFLTRLAALKWIKKRYSDVAERPDLWKMPVPVKVRVVLDVREDIQ